MIAHASTGPAGGPAVRRRAHLAPLALLAALAAAVPAACTDGTGPGSEAEVSVSITPGSASLTIGGSQQLTATVTGTTNAALSWEASCGAVAGQGSQVTYTAPWEAGACTVTATSAADPSKAATASLTITPLDPGLNLVSNGTFDTDLAGWSRLFHPTETTALWNAEDAQGLASSGSAELYDYNPGRGRFGNSILTQFLPAEPGRRYTLVASARLLEAGAGAVPAMELTPVDANGRGLGAQTIEFAVPSTDWTAQGLQLTTPEGTANMYVELGVVKADGLNETVVVRYDDVFLIAEL